MKEYSDKREDPLGQKTRENCYDSFWKCTPILRLIADFLMMDDDHDEKSDIGDLFLISF